MKCDTCKAEMTERPATAERPYFYVIGGLPKFALTSNVTVYECPRCHDEGVTIQAPGQLHRRIARVLLVKPTPLTGDELRFLRKHAGFSAQRFADMLSVDPSHLSRVENGHSRLGAGTERLARMIIATAEDGLISGEAIMAPTGTEDSDGAEVQEWLRFAASVGTSSPEWNRKMVPMLWETKKRSAALRAPGAMEPRPFMADIRGGRKLLKRPTK